MRERDVRSRGERFRQAVALPIGMTLLAIIMLSIETTRLASRLGTRVARWAARSKLDLDPRPLEGE